MPQRALRGVRSGSSRSEAVFEVGLAAGDRLHDVEFDGCGFERLHLGEAALVACSFTECVFTDVDLSMCELTDSTFNDCRFERCKAMGVNWSVARVSSFAPTPLTFTDSRLDFACFQGVSLSRWELRRCSLKETDFSDADLHEAVVRECDLTGARFQQTDLRQADLRDSYGFTLDPRENRTSGLVLSVSAVPGLLGVFGIRTEG